MRDRVGERERGKGERLTSFSGEAAPMTPHSVRSEVEREEEKEREREQDREREPGEKERSCMQWERRHR